MLDHYLIDFCAPTLASLKPGSLFSYAYESQAELAQQLKLWNRQLQSKGLYLTVLKIRRGRAQIYVYRRTQLADALCRPEISEFLAFYGYPRGDLDGSITRLRRRIRSAEDFPHEIGVFLGYPLEDVQGFIRHGGQDSKLTGPWKVYGNLQAAQKTFSQFDKCRNIYQRLWHQGRTVRQLTVSLT